MCHKNNAYIKLFSTILFLLTIVVGSITITYAFFDNLVNTKEGTIQIGEWLDLSAPADPENVEELIENIDNALITGCNCQFIDNEYVDDYLREVLFRESADGETILDPIFEDYTVQEILNVIDNIRQFIANFLVLNEENVLVYPDPEDVSPMVVTYNWGLLPGENQQVQGFLMMANLGDNGGNKPVMLSLSMENEDEAVEVDLADFSIEVLIDQTPFISNNPFPYGMTLRDREAWSDPIMKNNIKNYSGLIEVEDAMQYSTYAYRDDGSGNYEKKEYLHSYDRPLFHGDFRRFPKGLNYYLGKPKNSREGIQQLFEKDNSARPGFILSGKANGRRVEARVDIDDRKGESGVVRIIPFVIVLSRGIEVGLANQKTETVSPKIKITVINGWVHDEYNYSGTGHSC